MTSLREKVEGPAAMRELVQAARTLVDLPHLRTAYETCTEDCTHTRCLVVRLRGKLERFDEIRTGRERKPGLPPLDAAGILWVAAIDRVPIGERIEWVKALQRRVAQINAARAARVPAADPGMAERF